MIKLWITLDLIFCFAGEKNNFVCGFSRTKICGLHWLVDYHTVHFEIFLSDTIIHWQNTLYLIKAERLNFLISGIVWGLLNYIGVTNVDYSHLQRFQEYGEFFSYHLKHYIFCVFQSIEAYLFKKRWGIVDYLYHKNWWLLWLGFLNIQITLHIATEALDFLYYI